MNHGLRKDKREYTREIGLPGNTRHTRKTTAMQRGYAKQGLTQQQRTILKKEKTRAEKTKTSDDQWNKEGPLQKHGD